MGWIPQIFTHFSTYLIRKSIPNTSTQKLMAHYDTIGAAYHMTDDPRNKGKLITLQMDLATELNKRGIATDLGEAMKDHP